MSNNLIKVTPISLISYRSEMRKLLSLLFVFGSLILVFQYSGIHVDDAPATVSSPKHNSFNNSCTIVSELSAAGSSESLSNTTAAPPLTMTDTNNSTSLSSSSPSRVLVPPTARSSSPLVSKEPPQIPPEYSIRKIYRFREIVQMFVEGHRKTRSKVPQWSTEADRQLVYAQSEILKHHHHQQSLSSPSPLPANNDSINNDGLYPPLFHNISSFRRSYELMEKTLKIYIYKEGLKPIFHQPDGILTGTYAVEGWFMKLLESNNHNFVTQDPDKAHLFYIPFSSVHLRLKIPLSPLMKSYVDYLKNYLDLISGKYPYWNRTGGSDHFFTACHDWSEYITRDIMSSCIRALCDADVYKPFIFGKDVSLPTTRIHGTQSNPILNYNQPPSNRDTLAFFAGQSHGYVRPILFHHFENTLDPSSSSIKVFGGTTTLNGTTAYTTYMRRSKYCICPRGYAAFGPRFMEAIYFDCVPVLISDNYVPPFSDVLDWDKFAVFVSEREIHRLKEVLMSIPEKEYRRLYRGVRRVKAHFVWNEKPVKYDAFHMILYSLWSNRLLQFQPAAV